METSSRFSQGNSISSYQGVSGFINSRCLRLLRCCSAFNRVISVEPVVFLYVFTAYLYVCMFEFYAFNWNGWEELKENQSISNQSCVTVRELNAYGKHGNKTADRVQSNVAILNLFVGGASQIPGIISALILGPFSDKYGRRRAMGVVIVGLVLQSVLAHVIIHFNLPLYYFVLSSGLRTLTGGLAGLLTTSYSYIADISSKKWLTLRLGILEAVSFIASSLSLGVAGMLIQISDCHFLPVSWLMLAASVALILYLIIFVRESLNRQQTIQRQRLLKMGPKSLFIGFKIFCARDNPLWKLWFCLATLCITVINQIGTITIITLFLLHEPLQWKPGLIGGYLAAGELIHGLSLIIILPIMVGCSVRDPLIALCGVSIACVTNVGMGFVSRTWQMFLAGSIQGVDAIINPALKAIMSKLVPPQEQGSLFSLISATQVVSAVAAYVLYSLAYKTSLEMNWRAGTPFWLMAILYAISMPLLIALFTFSKRPDSRQLPITNDTKYTSSLPTTTGITQSIASSPTPIQPPQPHTILPKRFTHTDGSATSVEWALSKSQVRRCPHMFGPPSIGRDALERQSLLGRHSRGSSFGYYSASINSTYK